MIYNIQLLYFFGYLNHRSLHGCPPRLLAAHRGLPVPYPQSSPRTEQPVAAIPSGLSEDIQMRPAAAKHLQLLGRIQMRAGLA